jgi:hypothetical protein
MLVATGNTSDGLLINQVNKLVVSLRRTNKCTTVFVSIFNILGLFRLTKKCMV